MVITPVLEHRRRTAHRTGNVDATRIGANDNITPRVAHDGINTISMKHTVTAVISIKQQFALILS